MTRPPTPCGTRSTYIRHRQRGEQPCRPCTDANTKAQAEYQARRKNRIGTLPAAAHTMNREAATGQLDDAACKPWTGLHDSRYKNESDPQWRNRLARARAVCAACPVLVACRSTARHYRAQDAHLDGIIAGRPYTHGGNQ